MFTKGVRLTGLSVLCPILLAQAVPDGDSDRLLQIHEDMRSLKQGQDEVISKLHTILEILNGETHSVEDNVINTVGSPSLGQRDAKVAVVEFTDYQCPFCSAYARGTFWRLIHDYVDTGTVRYIVRNFPLQALHPLARKAAEASLCAADQGDFWALHHRMFADQSNLQAVLENIPAIGADSAIFAECMKEGKYAAAVAADLSEARSLRVRAMPTFFIGYADSGDPFRIKAVRSLVGNVAYGEFKNAIAEALEASKVGTGGR